MGRVSSPSPATSASPAPDSPVIFRTVEEEMSYLRGELKALQELVLHLSAKNDWLTKVVYGPKSERRPPALDPALGTQTTFLSAPAEAVATPPPAASVSAAPAVAAKMDAEAAKKLRNARKGKGADGKAKPINGGGRKPVNHSLRRVEVIIDLPEDQRTGPNGEVISMPARPWTRPVLYDRAKIQDYVARRFALAIQRQGDPAEPGEES